MKKLMAAVLLISVLCAGLAVVGFAKDQPPLLVDEADILTASEEKEIAAKLNEISEKHKVDVVVAILETLDGISIQSASDIFYDTNGYAGDGVMLLISMEEREWDILANGLCNEAIPSDCRETIGSYITPYLSDGDYAKAFDIFANECDYYINGHINGYPFEAGMSFIISLVIGIVVAFIATMVMKGQLKSVRANDAAEEYVKRGSMNVTLSRDLFLYRHITRRERPKEDSSSRSSGGGRGHTSGKF